MREDDGRQMECQSVASCISSCGASISGNTPKPTACGRPVSLRMAKVLANIGNSNGKSSDRPEAEIEAPKTMVAQTIIFCPALNFFAGGCTPLAKMPPPTASHFRSVRLGMLWITHRKNTITRPSMKAQAILLCTHLEATAMVEK